MLATRNRLQELQPLVSGVIFVLYGNQPEMKQIRKQAPSFGSMELQLYPTVNGPRCLLLCLTGSQRRSRFPPGDGPEKVQTAGQRAI